MMEPFLYLLKDGFKHVDDMTREDLLEVIESQQASMRGLQDMNRRDREFFLGCDLPRKPSIWQRIFG